MSRPPKRATVHLPLTLVREMDVLIDREAVHHTSRDDFVRYAVVRYLDELRARLAFAPLAAHASGLPPADATETNPRSDAADDRSPAPGIDTLDAVSPEHVTVA